MKTVCIMLTAMLASGLYAQQAGDLDSTFSGDGKQFTDFGSDYDEIKSIALQDDGKIVAVGHFFDAGTAGYDFIVARYDTSGNLDFSFDSDGYLTTDFDSLTNEAFSVVIQDDGKIIVAGDVTWYSSGFTSDFVLARYNSNGSLDTTFGSGGRVQTDFSGGEDHANSVAIQSNGKIVASGVTSPSGVPYDLAIARYNADGTLDTTFSNDGLFTAAIGGNDYWHAMLIQDDDKIVVAGNSIARFNSNGTLDSTFSSDGVASVGYNTEDVVQQSDGKIITAGWGNFNLSRFNGNGEPDSTFSGDGIVMLDFTPNVSDEAYSVALQSDGKIVAVGHTGDIWTGNFAVARFNADGSLDASFGTGGLLTTSFGTADDKANAVVIQDDGKIIAAGFTHGNVSSHSDFALARYISESVCNGAITDEPDDVTANSGSNASFSVEAFPSSAAFQWQIDDGSGWQNLSDTGQYSGTNNPTLTISVVTPSNGNQNFRCIITFGVDCADTSAVAVLTVEPTGNADIKSQIFLVYPNPSDGNIFLSISGHYSKIRVEVTDIFGKLVFTDEFGNANNMDIKLNEPDGLYFLTVQADTEIVISKIIVNRSSIFR